MKGARTMSAFGDGDPRTTLYDELVALRRAGLPSIDVIAAATDALRLFCEEVAEHDREIRSALNKMPVSD
jgi:hypothetical protein